MARLFPAFCVSFTIALGGAGAALGQTVADYKEALAKVPAAGTPAGVTGCRVLENYVYTSIPEGRRFDWVLPVVSLDGKTDPAIAQTREACETLRRASVIRFDAGTGEEIVTPPQTNDLDPAPSPEILNDPALRMPRRGRAMGTMPGGAVPGGTTY